ncbi:PAS domain-containing protein [Oleidesulfovibrio sp.]|uniref:PAS domain-containing protein n=1 Tax=Oleidesulfovibrio sp. TaxID=2909707 RepID=UPI003A868BE2
MLNSLLDCTGSETGKLTVLLDGMLVPIVVVHAGTGRVLWANRQALSMLGRCGGVLANPLRCTVRGLATSYSEGSWHSESSVWLCGESLHAEVLPVDWNAEDALLLQLHASPRTGVDFPAKHYWGCSGVVEAKERYHTVYDGMAQGVLFQDANGNIICANSTAQQMLGLDCEEGQASNQCFSAWNAVDVHGVPMTLADFPSMRALQAAQPVNKVVMGVQHPQHLQTRWLVVNATPLFAEGAEAPHEVFSTFEDISELIEIRQELETSTNRLRQVIDNAPLGVFIWRYGEGRFYFVHGNPAAERMFGVMTQKCEGKRMVEVLPNLRPEDLPKRLEQVMLTGIPSFTAQIEYSGDTVSGAFEVHAFKASDDLLCLMLQDITDRKRTEKEVERLAKLMHILIDFMPSVLIGVDASDKVTHWNHAARELTGITSDDAVGMPFTSLFDWPAFLRQVAIGECPAGGCVQIEDAAWESGGIVRNWSVTKYALPDDEGGGYAIRLDDVTERTHLREMMIQSEKMHSIAGLAAGMAHEINNPLGAISQAVQNARRRLMTELPASRKVADELGLDLQVMQDYMQRRDVPSFLDDIHKSCLRAGSIVSNMLAFSREERFSRATADINTVLRQSVALAESDYDQKKKYDIKRVQIQYDLADDLPEIWCNIQDLQQVFLNLLRNSSQAMSIITEEGYTPLLQLESRMLPQGMIEVSIRDNGPGMSKEVCKRCFEPFYTTKPVGDGTGLGLYVSYLLITQHQGSITVTSCKDKGTEFQIQLPALC